MKDLPAPRSSYPVASSSPACAAVGLPSAASSSAVAVSPPAAPWSVPATSTTHPAPAAAAALAIAAEEYQVHPHYQQFHQQQTPEQITQQLQGQKLLQQQHETEVHQQQQQRRQQLQQLSQHSQQEAQQHQHWYRLPWQRQILQKAESFSPVSALQLNKETTAAAPRRGLPSIRAIAVVSELPPRPQQPLPQQQQKKQQQQKEQQQTGETKGDRRRSCSTSSSVPPAASLLRFFSPPHILRQQQSHQEQHQQPQQTHRQRLRQPQGPQQRGQQTDEQAGEQQQLVQRERQGTGRVCFRRKSYSRGGHLTEELLLLHPPLSPPLQAAAAPASHAEAQVQKDFPANSASPPSIIAGENASLDSSICSSVAASSGPSSPHEPEEVPRAPRVAGGRHGSSILSDSDGVPPRTQQHRRSSFLLLSSDLHVEERGPLRETATSASSQSLTIAAPSPAAAAASLTLPGTSRARRGTSAAAAGLSASTGGGDPPAAAPHSNTTAAASLFRLQVAALQQRPASPQQAGRRCAAGLSQSDGGHYLHATSRNVHVLFVQQQTAHQQQQQQQVNLQLPFQQQEQQRLFACTADKRPSEPQQRSRAQRGGEAAFLQQQRAASCGPFSSPNVSTNQSIGLTRAHWPAPPAAAAVISGTGTATAALHQGEPFVTSCRDSLHQRPFQQQQQCVPFDVSRGRHLPWAAQQQVLQHQAAQQLSELLPLQQLGNEQSLCKISHQETHRQLSHQESSKQNGLRRRAEKETETLEQQQQKQPQNSQASEQGTEGWRTSVELPQSLPQSNPEECLQGDLSETSEQPPSNLQWQQQSSHQEQQLRDQRRRYQQSHEEKQLQEHQLSQQKRGQLFTVRSSSCSSSTPQQRAASEQKAHDQKQPVDHSQLKQQQQGFLRCDDLQEPQKDLQRKNLLHQENQQRPPQQQQPRESQCVRAAGAQDEQLREGAERQQPVQQRSCGSHRTVAGESEPCAAEKDQPDKGTAPQQQQEHQQGKRRVQRQEKRHQQQREQDPQKPPEARPRPARMSYEEKEEQTQVKESLKQQRRREELHKLLVAAQDFADEVVSSTAAAPAACSPESFSLLAEAGEATHGDVSLDAATAKRSVTASAPSVATAAALQQEREEEDSYFAERLQQYLNKQKEEVRSPRQQQEQQRWQTQEDRLRHRPLQQQLKCEQGDSRERESRRHPLLSREETPTVQHERQQELVEQLYRLRGQVEEEEQSCHQEESIDEAHPARSRYPAAWSSDDASPEQQVQQHPRRPRRVVHISGRLRERQLPHKPGQQLQQAQLQHRVRPPRVHTSPRRLQLRLRRPLVLLRTDSEQQQQSGRHEQKQLHQEEKKGKQPRVLLEQQQQPNTEHAHHNQRQRRRSGEGAAAACGRRATASASAEGDTASKRLLVRTAAGQTPPRAGATPAAAARASSAGVVTGKARAATGAGAARRVSTAGTTLKAAPAALGKIAAATGRAAAAATGRASVGLGRLVAAASRRGTTAAGEDQKNARPLVSSLGPQAAAAATRKQPRQEIGDTASRTAAAAPALSVPGKEQDNSAACLKAAVATAILSTAGGGTAANYPPVNTADDPAVLAFAALPHAKATSYRGTSALPTRAGVLDEDAAATAGFGDAPAAAAAAIAGNASTATGARRARAITNPTVNTRTETAAAAPVPRAGQASGRAVTASHTPAAAREAVQVIAVKTAPAAPDETAAIAAATPAHVPGEGIPAAISAVSGTAGPATSSAAHEGGLIIAASQNSPVGVAEVVTRRRTAAAVPWCGVLHSSLGDGQRGLQRLEEPTQRRDTYLRQGSRHLGQEQQQPQVQRLLFLDQELLPFVEQQQLREEGKVLWDGQQEEGTIRRERGLRTCAAAAIGHAGAAAHVLPFGEGRGEVATATRESYTGGRAAAISVGPATAAATGVAAAVAVATGAAGAEKGGVTREEGARGAAAVGDRATTLQPGHGQQSEAAPATAGAALGVAAEQRERESAAGAAAEEGGAALEHCRQDISEEEREGRAQGEASTAAEEAAMDTYVLRMSGLDATPPAYGRNGNRRGASSSRTEEASEDHELQQQQRRRHSASPFVPTATAAAAANLPHACAAPREEQLRATRTTAAADPRGSAAVPAADSPDEAEAPDGGVTASAMAGGTLREPPRGNRLFSDSEGGGTAAAALEADAATLSAADLALTAAADAAAVERTAAIAAAAAPVADAVEATQTVAAAAAPAAAVAALRAPGTAEAARTAASVPGGSGGGAAEAASNKRQGYQTCGAPAEDSSFARWDRELRAARGDLQQLLRRQQELLQEQGLHQLDSGDEAEESQSIPLVNRDVAARADAAAAVKRNRDQQTENTEGPVFPVPVQEVEQPQAEWEEERAFRLSPILKVKEPAPTQCESTVKERETERRHQQQEPRGLPTWQHERQRQPDLEVLQQQVQQQRMLVTQEQNKHRFFDQSSEDELRQQQPYVGRRQGRESPSMFYSDSFENSSSAVAEPRCKAGRTPAAHATAAAAPSGAASPAPEARVEAEPVTTTETEAAATGTLAAGRSFAVRGAAAIEAGVAPAADTAPAEAAVVQQAAKDERDDLWENMERGIIQWEDEGEAAELSPFFVGDCSLPASPSEAPLTMSAAAGVSASFLLSAAAATRSLTLSHDSRVAAGDASQKPATPLSSDDSPAAGTTAPERTAGEGAAEADAGGVSGTAAEAAAEEAHTAVAPAAARAHPKPNTPTGPAAEEALALAALTNTAATAATSAAGYGEEAAAVATAAEPGTPVTAALKSEVKPAAAHRAAATEAVANGETADETVALAVCRSHRLAAGSEAAGGGERPGVREAGDGEKQAECRVNISVAVPEARRASEAAPGTARDAAAETAAEETAQARGAAAGAAAEATTAGRPAELDLFAYSSFHGASDDFRCSFTSCGSTLSLPSWRIADETDTEPAARARAAEIASGPAGEAPAAADIRVKSSLQEETRRKVCCATNVTAWRDTNSASLAAAAAAQEQEEEGKQEDFNQLSPSSRSGPLLVPPEEQVARHTQQQQRGQQKLPPPLLRHQHQPIISRQEQHGREQEQQAMEQEEEEGRPVRLAAPGEAQRIDGPALERRSSSLGGVVEAVKTASAATLVARDASVDAAAQEGAAKLVKKRTRGSPPVDIIITRQVETKVPYPGARKGESPVQREEQQQRRGEKQQQHHQQPGKKGPPRAAAKQHLHRSLDGQWDQQQEHNAEPASPQEHEQLKENPQEKARQQLEHRTEQNEAGVARSFARRGSEALQPSAGIPRNQEQHEEGEEHRQQGAGQLRTQQERDVLCKAHGSRGSMQQQQLSEHEQDDQKLQRTQAAVKERCHLQQREKEAAQQQQGIAVEDEQPESMTPAASLDDAKRTQELPEERQSEQKGQQQRVQTRSVPARVTGRKKQTQRAEEAQQQQQGIRKDVDRMTQPLPQQQVDSQEDLVVVHQQERTAPSKTTGSDRQRQKSKTQEGELLQQPEEDRSTCCSGLSDDEQDAAFEEELQQLQERSELLLRVRVWREKYKRLKRMDSEKDRIIHEQLRQLQHRDEALQRVTLAAAEEVQQLKQRVAAAAAAGEAQSRQLRRYNEECQQLQQQLLEAQHQQAKSKRELQSATAAALEEQQMLQKQVEHQERLQQLQEARCHELAAEVAQLQEARTRTQEELLLLEQRQQLELREARLAAQHTLEEQLLQQQQQHERQLATQKQREHQLLEQLRQQEQQLEQQQLLLEQQEELLLEQHQQLHLLHQDLRGPRVSCGTQALQRAQQMEQEYQDQPSWRSDKSSVQERAPLTVQQQQQPEAKPPVQSEAEQQLQPEQQLRPAHRREDRRNKERPREQRGPNKFTSGTGAATFDEQQHEEVVEQLLRQEGQQPARGETRGPAVHSGRAGDKVEQPAHAEQQILVEMKEEKSERLQQWQGQSQQQPMQHEFEEMPGAEEVDSAVLTMSLEALRPGSRRPSHVEQQQGDQTVEEKQEEKSKEAESWRPQHCSSDSGGVQVDQQKSLDHKLKREEAQKGGEEETGQAPQQRKQREGDSELLPVQRAVREELEQLKEEKEALLRVQERLQVENKRQQQLLQEKETELLQLRMAPGAAGVQEQQQASWSKEQRADGSADGEMLRRATAGSRGSRSSEGHFDKKDGGQQIKPPRCTQQQQQQSSALPTRCSSSGQSSGSSSRPESAASEQQRSAELQMLRQEAELSMRIQKQYEEENKLLLQRYKQQQQRLHQVETSRLDIQQQLQVARGQKEELEQLIRANDARAAQLLQHQEHLETQLATVKEEMERYKARRARGSRSSASSPACRLRAAAAAADGTAAAAGTPPEAAAGLRSGRWPRTSGSRGSEGLLAGGARPEGYGGEEATDEEEEEKNMNGQLEFFTSLLRKAEAENVKDKAALALLKQRLEQAHYQTRTLAGEVEALVERNRQLRAQVQQHEEERQEHQQVVEFLQRENRHLKHHLQETQTATEDAVAALQQERRRSSSCYPTGQQHMGYSSNGRRYASRCRSGSEEQQLPAALGGGKRSSSRSSSLPPVLTTGSASLPARRSSSSGYLQRQSETESASVGFGPCLAWRQQQQTITPARADAAAQTERSATTARNGRASSEDCEARGGTLHAAAAAAAAKTGAAAAAGEIAASADALPAALDKRFQEALGTAVARERRRLTDRVRALEQQLLAQRSYYQRRLSAAFRGVGWLPPQRSSTVANSSSGMRSKALTPAAAALTAAAPSRRTAASRRPAAAQDRATPRQQKEEGWHPRPPPGHSMVLWGEDTPLPAPTPHGSSSRTTAGISNTARYSSTAVCSVGTQTTGRPEECDIVERSGGADEKRQPPNVRQPEDASDREQLLQLQRKEHFFPFLYRENRAMALLFAFWQLAQRFCCTTVGTAGLLLLSPLSTEGGAADRQEETHAKEEEEEQQLHPRAAAQGQGTTHTFSGASRAQEAAAPVERRPAASDVPLESRLRLLLGLLFPPTQPSDSMDSSSSTAAGRGGGAAAAPEDSKDSISFAHFRAAVTRVGCRASAADCLAAWEVVAGPPPTGTRLQQQLQQQGAAPAVDDVSLWKVSREKLFQRAKQTDPTFLFFAYCALTRRVKLQKRELVVLTDSNKALLAAAQEQQQVLQQQQLLQQEMQEQQRQQLQQQLRRQQQEMLDQMVLQHRSFQQQILQLHEKLLSLQQQHLPQLQQQQLNQSQQHLQLSLSQQLSRSEPAHMQQLHQQAQMWGLPQKLQEGEFFLPAKLPLQQQPQELTVYSPPVPLQQQDPLNGQQLQLSAVPVAEDSSNKRWLLASPPLFALPHARTPLESEQQEATLLLQRQAAAHRQQQAVVTLQQQQQQMWQQQQQQQQRVSQQLQHASHAARLEAPAQAVVEAAAGRVWPAVSPGIENVAPLQQQDLQQQHQQPGNAGSTCSKLAESPPELQVDTVGGRGGARFCGSRSSDALSSTSGEGPLSLLLQQANEALQQQLHLLRENVQVRERLLLAGNTAVPSPPPTHQDSVADRSRGSSGTSPSTTHVVPDGGGAPKGSSSCAATKRSSSRGPEAECILERLHQELEALTEDVEQQVLGAEQRCRDSSSHFQNKSGAATGGSRAAAGLL